MSLSIVRKPPAALLANKLIQFAIPVIVGLAIWFVPTPADVAPSAWRLLAIFVATIVGIIAKPLPMGAVAMIGIAATAITGTLSIKESLSGFGDSTIWLVVTAFFISRGFIKTGLGARVAYLFMQALGKKSLGVAYGLIGADLVLSPVMPSNTARGGGVIYPVLASIAKAYGSEPDENTARKIGAFLTTASFQGLIITSAMFLTAMAANPLAAQFASEQGVEITWGSWAVAGIVPGLLSLLIIPYLIYKIYPPEIKETPEAVELAREKLNAMGRMKADEWIMLGTFILLLLLWVFGSTLKVSATVTALVGLSILLVSNVLSWKDVLEEKGAWDTLIWFAALVMMASFLNSLGLIPWFSKWIGGLVGGSGWLTAFAILSLVYFYSHYFFASNTAHVSSMYSAFLAVAIVVGTPPVLAALVLAFFSNLFSSMTHYGTGPAPLYFGYGYVSMNDWWRIGFIVSLVNIVIWVGIGGLWWKILGLW